MHKINSSITTYQIGSLNDIQEHINTDSYVVVYLDYKVLIGKYSNGSFSFYRNEQIELKYIQRMRIFNKDEELMMWRSEGKQKARLRKDIVGTQSWVVDSKLVLFGTSAEKDGDYSILTEERGTEIILPFTDIAINDKYNRAIIKTRNYVDFNEQDIAGYIDCRFVDFHGSK